MRVAGLRVLGSCAWPARPTRMQRGPELCSLQDSVRSAQMARMTPGPGAALLCAPPQAGGMAYIDPDAAPARAGRAAGPAFRRKAAFAPPCRRARTARQRTAHMEGA